MMKLSYLLFLLACFSGNAQSPVTRTERYEKEFNMLVEQERAAFLRHQDLSGAESTGSTVASENFDVHYYRCEWQIDPAIRYIKGRITSYFTITAATDTIVFDLNKLLVVDSVVYHGSKMSFLQLNNDGLKIQWPAPLPAGRLDSLTIFYQGVPDSLRTGVLYQGFYRFNYAFWTQSEPYGSKDWWPCKNGLTDKADSLDIVITSPQVYTSSSNGVLVSEVTAAGNKTRSFRHRYSIASYLLGVGITEYALIKDSAFIGNRQMPVLLYSFPAFVNYSIPAVTVAKQSLVKFSELFGTYPFYKEQYCQTFYGGLSGGIEHQTNSFIIDIWPDLVAHELGHQWFGDKVTCGSWQDIWLNEGFAQYLSNIYYEFFDTALHRIQLTNMRTSITNVPDGSVWVRDTTSVARIFSSRLTYNKGAYVVRMLRWVLGDALFFKGIRTYVEDPAITFRFARTDDLKRVLSAVSGKNLDNFFDKWVYGEGFPSYQLTWKQNQNNWTHITLAQTTSHPSVSFYDMPVPIRFTNGTTDTTIVVNHQYSGQEFWVNPGFKADTAIIDPDMWLLTKNNTSIKEAMSDGLNTLKLYPNPAPDQLFISLKNPTDKKLSIRLFNTAGQVVYRKELETPGNDELISIPVSHLAHGVYIIKLKSEQAINTTRKIVR
jgi:aminopeptidase N